MTDDWTAGAEGYAAFVATLVEPCRRWIRLQKSSSRCANADALAAFVAEMTFKAHAAGAEAMQDAAARAACGPRHDGRGASKRNQLHSIECIRIRALPIPPLPSGEEPCPQPPIVEINQTDLARVYEPGICAHPESCPCSVHAESSGGKPQSAAPPPNAGQPKCNCSDCSDKSPCPLHADAGQEPQGHAFREWTEPTMGGQTIRYGGNCKLCGKPRGAHRAGGK